MWEKKYPCSQTPSAPQAMTMNAHILKQLSAAVVTDSIIQAAVPLWRAGCTAADGAGFAKAAPTAAITAVEAACAASIIAPSFALPSIAVPTAAMRNGGPGFTQKVSIRAAVSRGSEPTATASLMHLAAAG